jgi:hypothetical protein
MASKFALEKAAQAWCKDSTKFKQMDPALAEAFAEIIDEIISDRVKSYGDPPPTCQG